MALSDPHQASDFPGDPFLHSIPHQSHNHALQDPWVPSSPANDQPDGNREDIPPPVSDDTGPGIVQDPRHVDVAYQGVVDYHPQPLVLNPAYIFPDAGLAQGIPAQAQPNTPVNLERNPGYVPQHNAPGPVQATFPDPFARHIPTRNQAGAENLRRLAIHFLQHPDAQVSMVSMEAGAAGRCKVVIILESHGVS